MTARHSTGFVFQMKHFINYQNVRTEISNNQNNKKIMIFMQFAFEIFCHVYVRECVRECVHVYMYSFNHLSDVSLTK